MGGRLPTYRFIRRNNAAIASWFVVIEYRLCRRRHNLYSIATNQEAIRALFRVINRYVGNLPPMPGVFPDYPAPVLRNVGTEREMVMMRWGIPPPKLGGAPVTNIRNVSQP